MAGLNGKTALVTGASRGLGRQVAEDLARAGAQIMVGFRTRENEAKHVCQDIAAQGGSALPFQLDVRDAEATKAALRLLEKNHGPLNILINNAGVVRDNLYGMMSQADWDEVLAVNLTGAHNCCRAVLPRMMVRRQGVIVNIASLAALKASPGQANYAAAKGGLIALTSTLAVEAAGHGVRVNCVVPGLIDTGMTKRLDHRIRENKLKNIPLGRLGTEHEASGAVVFLASESAGYRVGQALVVDGGLSL